MTTSFCCHHKAYCPDCASDLARLRALNLKLRKIAGEALCRAAAVCGRLFYAPQPGCVCSTCSAVRDVATSLAPSAPQAGATDTNHEET